MLVSRTARAFATACFVVQTVTAQAQTLSFQEAIHLAEARSAKLRAQLAAVNATGELVERAAELPDPKLRFGIDNLPVTNPDAFRLNSDFMTMRRIGVMQEMPNGAKREARSMQAARLRDVEEAMLDASRAIVQQDAALAWIELYYAERGREIVGALVRESALEADTAPAAVAAGRMTSAGAIAARAAVELARDRLLERERNVAKSRAQLAAFIGVAARQQLASPPDTSMLPLATHALIAGLDAHPALKVYAEREALARAEVAAAEATRNPDWSVELSFGNREPNFSNMVSLMFSVDLPLARERRQDRDVAARLALLDQARSLREDARRAHEAELAGLAAEWEVGVKRIERYEKLLGPLARDRVEAALAAYRGGRGDLAAVLEARRAEVETRLGELAAALERDRAWARLTYVVPHEAKP
jgi:outer membrane protein TolC